MDKKIGLHNKPTTEYISSRTGRHLSINRLILAITCLTVTLACILLSGCAKKEDAKTLVLTTGFSQDEVFKLEDEVCTLPEIMVYLVNNMNRYEKVYGSKIWDVETNKLSMKDSVKANALADISQIKAMKIRAAENNVALNEEELSLAKEAGSDYFASLSSYEISTLNLTEDIIVGMYEEYALANKLYSEIIKDINPEISDDEARTITVEHILIKTYTIDGTGEKIEYTEEAKARAYEKAEEILAMAKDGEHEFKDLVLEYSEGDTNDYSFCKGDTDPIFEEAAFELGKDEISDIITTQYGYHIIKCLNTFNRDETDMKKIAIADEQREQVFGQQYDDYAATLMTYLNEDLWNSVEVTYDPGITTDSFFEVYHKYFD